MGERAAAASRLTVPRRPRTVRFVPDAHGAPREATTAVVPGQPWARQPHRRHESDHEDVDMDVNEEEEEEEEAEEGEAEEEEAEEEGEEEEAEVERRGQGEEEENEVEEEEEDDDEDEEAVEEEEEEEEEEEAVDGEEEEEEDDADVSGSTASGKAGNRCSSQVTGISWNQRKRKWEARAKLVDGKRAYLGIHATVEAAAQAIDSYPRDGVDPVRHPEGTSQFEGVYWNNSTGRWAATLKRTHIGYHATEEAAAQADNNYVNDSGIPAKQPPSSHFKGVCWANSYGKWRAQSQGKSLGHHATEKAAAQAYTNYLRDGVDPGKHPRDGTSQFKGVHWDRGCAKWRAQFKGKFLGLHATEEAAAQAYSNYVENGIVPGTQTKVCKLSHLLDGVDSEKHSRDSSSQFKGVRWDKFCGKWKAYCHGKSLGSHDTEEDASQAYTDYAENGVVSVKHRDVRTSQFKGVHREKGGKWRAISKHTNLGQHATEEAAAQAYNDYVEVGRCKLPVSKPELKARLVSTL